MSDNATGVYFADWPASVLEVTGGDRAKFLHSFSTADVVKMQPGEVREAFVTSVKGHVLYHVLLAAKDDRIVVVALADDAAPLAAHLDRYLIREDVQLQLADRRPLLVLGGADDNPAVDSLPFPVASPAAWLTWDEAPLAERGYRRAERMELDGVRVAAGWPLAGVDFGEGTLPQELSRDPLAISFTKGCYLGQETVARLDALGHVNKQLVRVLAKGETQLAAGDALLDGEKPVGTITTTNAAGNAGLAMVRRGSNDAGHELRAPSGLAIVERLGE